MSRLTLIVAATKTNGIGQNARLPWRLPKEMAYFARTTSNAPEGSSNAVIMGRNTWESIPKKFRPLPNRMNIIISQNNTYELVPSDTALAYRVDNLEAAVNRLTSSDIYRAFIIGGASLYSKSIALPPSSSSAFVDRVLLTRIVSPAFEQCDVFMPDFLWETLGKDDKVEWKRASHEDLQTWVGFEVPEGTQEEHGVDYEFQMWVREPYSSQRS